MKLSWWCNWDLVCWTHPVSSPWPSSDSVLYEFIVWDLFLSYHQCQCSILIGWKLQDISCIRLFYQTKVYHALSCLIFSVSRQLWRHHCLCWVRWLNGTRHDVTTSRRSSASQTELEHFSHVCSMFTNICKTMSHRTKTFNDCLVDVCECPCQGGLSKWSSRFAHCFCFVL